MINSVNIMENRNHLQAADSELMKDEIEVDENHKCTTKNAQEE